MGGCGRWHAGGVCGCRRSWTRASCEASSFPRRGRRLLENALPAAESVFRRICPFSRRGKPISSKFYRLPAARNRFSSDFSPFPPRETVFRRIFSISRRGKAFFGDFSPFPAAGRRFSKVLIGFPRREGVFEGQRSVSRLILAFPENFDRFRAAERRFAKSEIGLAFHFGVSRDRKSALHFRRQNNEEPSRADLRF